MKSFKNKKFKKKIRKKNKEDKQRKKKNKKCYIYDKIKHFIKDYKLTNIIN